MRRQHKSMTLRYLNKINFGCLAESSKKVTLPYRAYTFMSINFYTKAKEMQKLKTRGLRPRDQKSRGQEDRQVKSPN